MITTGGRAEPCGSRSVAARCVPWYGMSTRSPGGSRCGRARRQAIDGVAVRGAQLLHVLHEQIFGEVIGGRRLAQVLAGADEALFRQRLLTKPLVDRRALGPGATPVVPASQHAEDVIEIADRDAVRAEARHPVGRMMKPRIVHAPFVLRAFPASPVRAWANIDDRQA